MLQHCAKLYFLQWDTAWNFIIGEHDDNDDDGGGSGGGGGDDDDEEVDKGDYQGIACPAVEPALLLK